MTTPRVHLFMRRIALISGIAALALVPVLALVSSGFCVGRLAFVDERELVQAAASLAMQHNQIFREANSEFYVPQRPVPYQDSAEFMRLNPECCRRVTEPAVDAVAEFFRGLMGLGRVAIEVRYQVRYIDDGGARKAEPTRLRIWVSHCGVACFDC